MGVERQIPGLKAEHYESKRKDYMVPDWNEDSVIDQFEITIQSHDPVELRRQVCASMTAFWQADDAYIESKQRIADLTAEVETLKGLLREWRKTINFAPTPTMCELMERTDQQLQPKGEQP